jgi:hypothetical protein
MSDWDEETLTDTLLDMGLSPLVANKHGGTFVHARPAPEGIEGDCLTWLGKGHPISPMASLDGGRRSVRRAVWEYLNEEMLDAQLWASTVCEVSMCLNPAHIKIIAPGNPAARVRIEDANLTASEADPILAPLGEAPAPCPHCGGVTYPVKVPTGNWTRVFSPRQRRDAIKLGLEWPAAQ